jgi:hypothetical protein
MRRSHAPLNSDITPSLKPIFIPTSPIKSSIPSLMWWGIASRLRLSQLLPRLSPLLTSSISIAERNLLITPPFTLYPPSGPSPYRLRRAVPPSYPENYSLLTFAPDTLPPLMPTLSKNPLSARKGACCVRPGRAGTLAFKWYYSLAL